MTVDGAKQMADLCPKKCPKRQGSPQIKSQFPGIASSVYWVWNGLSHLGLMTVQWYPVLSWPSLAWDNSTPGCPHILPVPDLWLALQSPHSLSGMYHSFPFPAPNSQCVSGGVGNALYCAEAARDWCESSFYSPNVVCVKAVSTHCPCLASFLATVLGGQKWQSSLWLPVSHIILILNSVSWQGLTDS